MSILVFPRVNENGVLLASVESQTQPRHPRILVAHHEVAIREVLDQILREGGCEVCTVESSAEAVSQAPHFRPDTLIIEPIMPELDGFKAAKQIAQATNCRVLFLESRSSSVAERKEWLNGVRQEIANCDLLLLPFDREDVLETVFGHRKPEKEQTDTEQWYKGPDGSWYIKEKDYSLAALVVVVLLIGWVALVFYAPHQKHLTKEEQEALQKGRIAVANVLQTRLTGSKVGSSNCEGMPISCTELDNALNDILGQPSKNAGAKSQPHDDISVMSLDCPPQLSKAGKYQFVELPDGTFRRFSASASEAQIMSAIAKDFPACVYNQRTDKLESAPSKTKKANLPPFDINGNRIDNQSEAVIDVPTPQQKPAVLRIEPRGGNNLYIYLRKSDFETVLYPDRQEFVRAVGKAWCDNTGENSHWLLPSVYIGDIRTGEELASYSCVFDSVS